jgi:predicted double-glycine peptidase
MINALNTRTQYVIATCVVVVFGTISVSIYNNRPQTLAPDAQPAALVNEVELALQATGGNEDTDLDGLKVWEENLWGTSDKSTDSDGDGTPDGEEIELGRNPMKPGDDLIATTTPIDGYTPQDTDPNSLTSRIARSIFENVSELSTSESYTAELGSQVAEQIATAAASTAEQKIVFSVEDVNINRQPTEEDIRQYGNLLMQHILENMKEVYMDPTAHEDLGVPARGFRNTADDLAQMRVPSQIAGTHSKIVNNYYNIFEALEYVYYYKKDPAQALLALRTYSEIAEEQPKQFLVVENYLKANGIIYRADELGAVAFPSLIGFDSGTNENE